MDAYQESVLTGGADCFIHWHSSDRVVDHGTLQQLQQIVRETNVTTTPYVVTPSDDILLCSVATAVTFPLAKNGREIEVVMTGTGNVTVNFTSPDMLYGESSALLEVKGTALHFKAVTSGWILV